MFTMRVDDDISLQLMHDLNAAEDAQLIIDNADHIGQWMTWTDDYDEAAFRDYAKLMRKGFGKETDWGTRILYQGQYVGSCGLHMRPPAYKMAEIGYWLAKEFTGRGIVTRASHALADYAFTTRDLNKVLIRVATENTKSRAVPERMNFFDEGLIHNDILLRGTYLDVVCYTMLRDDWKITHHHPEFVLPVDTNLDLRLVETRHAQTIFDTTQRNRDHLRQWLPWVDKTERVDDTEAFIKTSLQQYADNNGFQAGIWHNNKFVGMVGFHYWDFTSKRTEIGYWLSKDATGQGIMTRAVRTLVDLAFNTLGLNRVAIRCATGNDSSCAIPRRLGFKLEGISRQAEMLNDRIVDHNRFYMLKKDWQ